MSGFPDEPDQTPTLVGKMPLEGAVGVISTVIPETDIDLWRSRLETKSGHCFVGYADGTVRGWTTPSEARPNSSGRSAAKTLRRPMTVGEHRDPVAFPIPDSQGLHPYVPDDDGRDRRQRVLDEFEGFFLLAREDRRGPDTDRAHIFDAVQRVRDRGETVENAIAEVYDSGNLDLDYDTIRNHYYREQRARRRVASQDKTVRAWPFDEVRPSPWLPPRTAHLAERVHVMGERLFSLAESQAGVAAPNPYRHMEAGHLACTLLRLAARLMTWTPFDDPLEILTMWWRVDQADVDLAFVEGHYCLDQADDESPLAEQPTGQWHDAKVQSDMERRLCISRTLRHQFAGGLGERDQPRDQQPT